MFACDKQYGFMYTFETDCMGHSPRKFLAIICLVFFGYKVFDFTLLNVIKEKGGQQLYGSKHDTLQFHHLILGIACFLAIFGSFERFCTHLIGMIQQEFTSTMAQSHDMFRTQGVQTWYLYIHNCVTLISWFIIRIVWAKIFANYFMF